ncbi:PAS-domain containing protein, partial [Stenotrophomonas maltophilia]
GQTVVSLLPDASSQGAETSTSIQHLGDGRVVAIESRKLSDGGLVATYEDITERRHAEAKVAFLAGHDALTNLPNRTMLAERIEQALSQV